MVFVHALSCMVLQLKQSGGGRGGGEGGEISRKIKTN